MSKPHHLVKYGGNIPVLFFKEGEMFVSYSPALDLSSCGSTFEEAKKNFDEALHIFFQECLKHGTLEVTLESCGWKKSHKDPVQWQPPVLVGQESMAVGLPSIN